MPVGYRLKAKANAFINSIVLNISHSLVSYCLEENLTRVNKVLARTLLIP